MNKIKDIECEITLILDQSWVRGDGPLTLAEVEDRLPPESRDDDRLWLDAAVYAMLHDGRMRAVGCDHSDHSSHDGGCLGGDGPVSQFNEGDRVFHRQLRMAGTYQGRHNWGTDSPETSSYVLFDGDKDYPDGRPVTTAQLELLDENGGSR